MRPMLFSDQSKLTATKNLLSHFGELVQPGISVKLWDGTLLPLGPNSSSDLYLSINNPNTITSILRKPTLENLLLNYVSKNVDFHGGDIYDFAEAARNGSQKKKWRHFNKWLIFRNAIPLFFGSTKNTETEHRYLDEETGRVQDKRKNKEFIQFHYDLSNDFYQLFLDDEMLYSCGYFKDWDNSLEQAQFDKLEMICRKLQLKEGDRFLDIGCGWGGLVCYAAKNYGVKAHGVTLSQAQLDFAKAKIKRLGLESLVTVELKDYNDLTGEYDKISSIGMYEHVGIANFPGYFKKIRSLLCERGILLNHGITRRAKATKRMAQKIKPLRRLVLKYIFPGSELDDIGNTVQLLEKGGFEVHDVEAWREHYALTTKHWCKRLSARKDEAVKIVGMERYRMWIAYLLASSLGFKDDSMRIFQVVATNRQKKGASNMPPTREHLYKEKTKQKEFLKAV